MSEAFHAVLDPPWYKRWAQAFGASMAIQACVVVILIVMFGLFGNAQAAEVPPEEYQHQPNMPVEITPVHVDLIANTCQSIIRIEVRIGCAFVTADKCSIFIKEMSWNFGWRQYERLLIHELAHCNGWVHEVRGNRVLPTRTSMAVNTQDRSE